MSETKFLMESIQNNLNEEVEAEILRMYKADEHAPNVPYFDQVPDKLVEWYTYINIETDLLGDFYVAYNMTTEKIDFSGGPWKFLQKEEYKLTPEQKELVEANKEFIETTMANNISWNKEGLEESEELKEEKVDLDKEDAEFNKAFATFLKQTKSKKKDNDNYREHGWYSQDVIFRDNTTGTFWWHASENKGDVTIHRKDINNYGLPLENLINKVNKILDKSMNESEESNSVNKDIEQILNSITTLNNSVQTNEGKEILERLSETLADTINELNIEVDNDLIG